MNKKKVVQKFNVIALLCLLAAFPIILSSCSKDEDDNEIRIPDENSGGGGSNTEKSNFTQSQFIGTWVQTKINDHGQEEICDADYEKLYGEWGVQFNNDKVHGRFYNIKNGGAKNFDFKWWLGSGNEIEIMELAGYSDVPGIYIASFKDGGSTLLLYSEGTTTFYKKK